MAGSAAAPAARWRKFRRVSFMPAKWLREHRLSARCKRAGNYAVLPGTRVSKESQGSAATISALLTFCLGEVHVMVEPNKKPGGADEVDIVACRAGSGLRLKRGAGTRLSITSGHDDRAVSRRWPDRYAWADPGRGYASVARTDHYNRERDRCGLDHRGWSCRPGGAGRLHAQPRQLDEPHGGRRALPHLIRPAQGLRADIATHLCPDAHRRKKQSADEGCEGADRLAQGQSR